MRGNEHAIIGIDSFTRFIDSRALPDVTAPRFNDFLTDWCGRFGVPKEILTDNARTFDNQLIKDLTRSLGTEHRFSTPEHSRRNGIAERAPESLEDKLNLISKESNMAECNWDMVLPMAVLSLNSTVHKTTGYTPFELTYGRRQPIKSKDITTNPMNVYDLHAELISARITEMTSIATDNQLVPGPSCFQGHLRQRTPTNHLRDS